MNLNSLFDRIEALGEPLLRPVTSRLNPIMVKEVRQALRGNYFQWSFMVVTLIATIVGSFMLFQFARYPDARGGMSFFVSMFAILSAAVNVLVPFQSFLSVGAEWEENTYDLLVLSELTPLQIAKGKLLSGLVQSLLFYVAFAPFLVFSFLLRGLDMGSAAWVLCACLVYSASLCSLAICLSSLVSGKFARVLLMAILVALLVMGCFGSVGLSYMVLEERLVHDAEFLQGTAACFSLAAVLSAFFMLLSASRFTHAEENRSTGLRILVTVMTLVSAGWMAYFYQPIGDVGFLHAISVVCFVALTFFGMIFCAESERLGRRTALMVPRGRVRSLLAAPFLPGGGRGVLHYFMNLGILLGVAVMLPWLTGRSAGFFTGRSLNACMGALPYLILYLLLPTLLFSRFSGRLRNRILARVSVPLLCIFGILIPTIVLFLLTGDGDALEHLGNPFTTIDDAIPGGYDQLWLVAFAAMLISVFNLPRVLRGFGEVEIARKRRLERESDAHQLGAQVGGDGAPESDVYASS